jgi:predicted outer membrane repeat protein
MSAAGIAFVPAAEAAPAVVHVPCSVAGLAGDMASAESSETLSLAPRCVYRLTAALPVVSQDLTITGNQATLRPSTAPGTPELTLLSADAGTLSITDLNFTDGDVAIGMTSKAGIALTVHGGTFTGNHGGAIVFSTQIGGGGLSVTGATFTRNTSPGNGGAIYVGGQPNATTLTGDVFTGNTASGAGGAFDDSGLFGADITNSTFMRNKAQTGGAIYDYTITGNRLSNVVVHGNAATGDGGGIYAYEDSTEVTGSKISGNHAGGDGGGIYEFAAPDYPGLTLTRTIVRGNTAEDGGGVYTADSVADLTNSAVSGNAATADGGGIYNDLAGRNEYSLVSVGNSRISGNQAGKYGGGIYNLGDVSAGNTRIVRNTAASEGGGIYEGSSASANLMQSPVLHNEPDNCGPPGSITGCVG